MSFQEDEPDSKLEVAMKIAMLVFMLLIVALWSTP